MIFCLESSHLEASQDGPDLAPRLVAAGLGDADDQQGEEADQDVASDPVFEAVVDRAQCFEELVDPPFGETTS